MGGLIRHALWVAPVAVLVIVLTFWLNRENNEDMRVQDAGFERDWNEGLALISRKDPVATKRFETRAVVAQKQYSSARLESERQRQRLKNTENAFDHALDDFDKKSGGVGR